MFCLSSKQLRVPVTTRLAFFQTQSEGGSAGVNTPVGDLDLEPGVEHLLDFDYARSCFLLFPLLAPFRKPQARRGGRQIGTLICKFTLHIIQQQSDIARECARTPVIECRVG